MVNRYERPAEAQFINTYAPIPFEQLYQLGSQAKAEVDLARNELASSLDKWSDFRSPSQTDTQTWYNETIGKIEPVVNELATNLDLLKTAEGRARLRTAVNNVDRAKLSSLMQSRDALLQRQKIDQELMLSGRYNPEWHGMDYTGYDTTRSGIFNDVSPLAYASIKDLTDKYVNNLKQSFIKKEGGYDYYGVTNEDIRRTLDQHRAGILATPEAQKHVETMMRTTGISKAEAENRFMEQAVTDNREYEWSDRRENRFDLMDREFQNEINKVRAKTGAEAEVAAGNLLTRKAATVFVTRPVSTVVDPETGDVVQIEEKSPFERAQEIFQPGGNTWNRYALGQEVGPNGVVVPIPDSQKVPKYVLAERIVTDALEDLGGMAKESFAQGEFGTNFIRSIRGEQLYNAQNVTGFKSLEGYVDDKMQVPSKWSSKVHSTLENDMWTGNIPNAAFYPTSQFALEEAAPGNEVFMQKYMYAVPVSYFINKIAEDKANQSIIGKISSTDSYFKLRDNKKFADFLKTINARLAPDNGNIVGRGNTPAPKTSTLGSSVDTDAILFGDPYYSYAQSYADMYVEVPVLRKVAANDLRRFGANQADIHQGKLGTSTNAAMQRENEVQTFGQ